MNDYQKMMQSVCVPEGLNEKVLQAARQKQRPACSMRIIPTAVCVLLAAALLLGGGWLGKREDGDSLLSALTVTAAARGVNGGVFLSETTADELVGTVQTLSLTFADGGTETGNYRLLLEEMRTCYNEDGEAALVPVLEGDSGEVSGLYAEAEHGRFFSWPVKGSGAVWLSAPYGKRSPVSEYFHSGIDIPAAEGTEVTAAAAGTVTEAAYDVQRGNYLIIDHGEGLSTLYGHCLELLTEEGTHVPEGGAVALVGSTGMSTGPHLHFEVRQDEKAQNPVAYFSAEVRQTLHAE